MRDRGTNVLATLRQLRRAVASAVAPALLSSLLAGAACPAMSAAAPGATHSAHDAPAAQHAGHAAHGHHAHDAAPAAPAPPNGDCPHCLGGHAAANAGTVDCEVAATAQSAPPQAPTPDTPALAIPTYVPPAASAIPPLIRARSRATPAANSSVPLRFRHCVLLI